MAGTLELHPDRLFPADPGTRSIARNLYAAVADSPIVSPHGHTDPAWFATNDKWTDATTLLLSPDHYLYRMLYSQGVSLKSLGVADRTGEAKTDSRDAWRLLASCYHLFRGTPSRLWLDHVFADVFGIDVALDARGGEVSRGVAEEIRMSVGATNRGDKLGRLTTGLKPCQVISDGKCCISGGTIF